MISKLAETIPDNSKPFEEYFCDALGVSYSTWDAIVAWRDIIHHSNLSRISKRNYITAMLKLIEEGIIDYKLPLLKITPVWYTNACFNLESLSTWSEATKQPRKTCLKSFYEFVSEHQYKDYPTFFGESSKHTPTMQEITFMLSSIEERSRTKDLDPVVLFETVANLNKRDALIVSLMILLGCTLEEILDLRKKDFGPDFIIFKEKKEKIPATITQFIKENSRSENNYAFTSAHGKRLRRTQVIRNLKLASKLMGLDFEITPKVLQGFAVAYMPVDRLKKLEKFLSRCN